jgi:hypothetical protein
MRYRTRRVIGGLLIISVATSLMAASIPQAGVFVYSSLCSGPADPEGDEITLLRGAAGDTVIFTRTEGPIMAPLLAYGPDVKIDNVTGHIKVRFLDPEWAKAGEYIFEGTVTEQVIELSRTVGGYIKLPRVRALSRKLAACKR